LAATTESLTKIIDTGLDLDLVYKDNDWLGNWMEKYLPSWMRRISRFVRKTNALRNRLEKIRKSLRANGSDLIYRMNLYDKLKTTSRTALTNHIFSRRQRVDLPARIRLR
jgi:hypothetical protein